MGKGGEGEEGNRESGMLCLLEWSLNCSCAFEKEAMYMMFLVSIHLWPHTVHCFMCACFEFRCHDLVVWNNNETGALLTRDS